MPVRSSTVVAGWALLVKVSVALAEPATEGLNVTVKGRLSPALMVTGSEIPLTLNCELLESAAVTVTLPPVALRVPKAVPLPPATTLPSGRVGGLTLSWVSPDGPEPPDPPVPPVPPEPEPPEPEPPDPAELEPGVPLLTPWQADIKSRPAKTSKAPDAFRVCRTGILVSIRFLRFLQANGNQSSRI